MYKVSLTISTHETEHDNLIRELEQTLDANNVTLLRPLESPTYDPTLMAAAIGASATILTGLLGGVFAVLARRIPDASDAPRPRPRYRVLLTGPDGWSKQVDDIPSPIQVEALTREAINHCADHVYVMLE